MTAYEFYDEVYEMVSRGDIDLPDDSSAPTPWRPPWRGPRTGHATEFLRSPGSRVFIDMFGAGSAFYAQVPLYRTAITAIRNGFAVLPVEAGKTEPLCILVGLQAREPHPCGPHHAVKDEAVAKRVFQRLAKTHDRMNLAVVIGPSRLVAVVCDTDEAFMVFRHDWADRTGNPGLLRSPTPTVVSPVDGCAQLFGLPPGVFLNRNAVDTLHRNGYRVEWGMSPLLVPPSVLPEGTVEPGGCDIPLVPQWLFNEIRSHIAAAERG